MSPNRQPAPQTQQPSHEPHTRNTQLASTPDSPAVATSPERRPRAKTLGTAQSLPRLAVTLDEAAQMLGVSRDFLDEHVRHELRVIRRGRLRLVAVVELERWVERSSALALDA
jgi:excisionase family DNA binding protein